MSPLSNRRRKDEKVPEYTRQPREELRGTALRLTVPVGPDETPGNP